MVTQLGDGLYVLNEGGANASLLQLSAGMPARDVSFGSRLWTEFEGKDHVRWGISDAQPNLMARIIEKNDTVQSLLETQRDMVYGAGIDFYRCMITGGKKTWEPFTDTRLEEWKVATDLTEYIIAAINQRLNNANIFTRWQYDPRQEWFTLDISDSFMTRVVRPEKGSRIREFRVNPYFGESLYFAPGDSETLKAFDPRNKDANIGRTVTMSHSREHKPGQPFYAFPSWWCAKESIELANLIKAFHKSGIMNGYNIKYLIRMPQDYFDRDGNRNVDAKEVKERWSKFSDNLSSWLAGQENVNKTMLIRYLRGADGKALDSVDVQPLENKMSDDAYDKVSSTANQAIANSVGVLPTLAGVNPGKGNDSGSQIRVMSDYQQAFRTPIHRYYVLKEVNTALRMMGYKGVEAQFSGIQITTLLTQSQPVPGL